MTGAKMWVVAGLLMVAGAGAAAVKRMRRELEVELRNNAKGSHFREQV
jgi:hypothetical protein